MKRTALAGTTILLGLLVGCGSTSAVPRGAPSDAGSSDAGGSGSAAFAQESPGDIIAAATADMRSLTHVKLTGDLDSGGQEIRLDLAVSSAGDCTGTIGIGSGDTEIRSLGGTSWFKPDPAFWREEAPTAAGQIIDLVGTKYVVLPAGDDDFSTLCDLGKLVDGFFDAPTTGTTYSTGGVTTVDGQEAVALVQHDPVKGESTSYVLTSSPHYLVQISKAAPASPSASASTSASASAAGDAGGAGVLTFSDFDQPFTVTPPAASDVIDLSSLGG